MIVLFYQDEMAPAQRVVVSGLRSGFQIPSARATTGTALAKVLPVSSVDKLSRENVVCGTWCMRMCRNRRRTSC